MILLLQITVSEKDQFCFWSCVCDKGIFMKRGIITLVFLNIKSASLMSENVFNLFLIPGQQCQTSSVPSREVLSFYLTKKEP